MGNVDGLGSGEEALEKGTSDAESAGARDGLRDGDAALGQGGGVCAVGELGSGLDKVGHAGDACILLVEAAVDNLLLGGLDGREDIWLSAVVAVGRRLGRLARVRRSLDFVPRLILVEVAIGLESFGDSWSCQTQLSI